MWRLIRIYFRQIVTGTMLGIMVISGNCILATYQREQRIAREIESIGGQVEFLQIGQDRIPASLQERLWLLERVKRIEIIGYTIPAKVLRDLGNLTNVKDIVLDVTPVTDTGLEQLGRLTSLETLFLVESQVTDNGLEHLKRLSRLKLLYIQGRNITEKGRQNLRIALPNCRVKPESSGQN